MNHIVNASNICLPLPLYEQRRLGARQSPALLMEWADDPSPERVRKSPAHRDLVVSRSEKEAFPELLGMTGTAALQPH